MKVQLNTDKSPFLHVGPYSFTYETPEYEVVVNELPEELKKQILYNLRRGVLKTEDKEEIKNLMDVQPDTPVPANVIPIRPADVAESMEDTIDKNRKMLKKILLGTIPSVKKEAALLRLGNLRNLKELEEEGKNRKKLVDFFDKRLDAHKTEVAEAKGTDDMNPGDRLNINVLSTQLSDIVESEEEQVFIPEEVLNNLNKGA